MKAIKIEDGYNSERRDVTGLELLLRYIFSSRYPKKFEPGDYKIGDYVYVVNEDGSITIYECQKTGHYDRLDTRYWIAVDITTMIKNSVSEELMLMSTEEEFPILFQYSDYTTQDLTEYGRNIEETTWDNGSVSVPATTFRLPKTYTYDSHVDIFSEGKYISSNDYDIVKKGHQYWVKFHSVIREPEILIMTPKNHNAKLFGYVDIPVVPVNGEVIIPLGEHGINNAYIYHLYTNKGLLCDYTNITSSDTDGILTIKGIPESIPSVMVSFMYSRSKAIKMVMHTCIIPVKERVNQYRNDLGNTLNLEENNFWLYQDNERIPSTKGYVHEGVLSITDDEYYAELGSTMVLRYLELSVDLNLATRNYDVMEVVPTDRTIFPIPILNFDNSVHDLIMFKASGIHVSRSRYYPRDGYVFYYEHDDSLSSGDTLMVQVFNEDSSVNICSRIITFEGNGNMTVPIPLDSFDKNMMSFILFDSAGQYISQSRYRLDEKNNLVFRSGYAPADGTKLEFIFNTYNSNYTNTVTRLDTVMLKTDNEFEIPLNSYDEDSYIIILFNNKTGCYIDKTNYTIGEDRIIRIHSGTGVPSGSSVDVYTIKTFDRYISVGSVASVIGLI